MEMMMTIEKLDRIGRHGINSPLPLPSAEKLNAILDPLWQNGHMGRRQVYARISEKLGWNYHTAQIRTVEEARDVYRIVQQIAKGA
jgi:hypothetical protein